MEPRSYGIGQTANNKPSQAAVDALFPTVAPGTVKNDTQLSISTPTARPSSSPGGLGYKGPLNA